MGFLKASCTCQPPRRQLLWCFGWWVGRSAGRPAEHPKTKTDLMFAFVLRGQPPTISSAFLLSWKVVEPNQTELHPASCTDNGNWKLIKERTRLGSANVSQIRRSCPNLLESLQSSQFACFPITNCQSCKIRHNKTLKSEKKRCLLPPSSSP